jgi:phospholipid/cholesterol/gamma-HCH transport system substrate-binding protein
MANKAQKIRVGLFTAAAIALAAFVLIVFGGMRFWEKHDTYRIVFDDSVIGLETGAEVFVNGIKVGAVTDIAIAPEDIRKVAVKIKVKHGTPIRQDTKAMLQFAGITGLKTLDLRGGTLASPQVADGGTIQVGPGLLDKLQAQAEQLADQTNVLMKQAGTVMERASDVMAKASALTDSLAAVTEPAKVAATNFATMSGSLKAMVDENRVGLRQSLAAVKETASHSTALLDGQVTALFANADGLVGEMKKLISGNEGTLRAAMFDLRQASRSFKELARDVRQRPSRLLFSSEPSERKLP